MESEQVVALEEIDSATFTGEAVGDPSDQTADEVEVEVSTESGVSQPDPPGVGEDGTGLGEGADECAVCLCVLCEPVELACGHTFCRMCAFKALHNRAAGCPLCRSPHPRPQQPEDLVLAQSRADAIAGQYPPEFLRERAEAAQAEREAFERELARQRELLFFVMRAPSFGLRSASAMHLFEPRYRWLAARVIEENDGRFGFVTSGNPAAGGVGVVARIIRHRRNFNGSYDVVIVGEDSFVIESISATAVPDVYGGPACPPLAYGTVSFTGSSLPAWATGDVADGGGAADGGASAGTPVGSRAGGSCEVM